MARDYKTEYENYHGQQDQIDRRNNRNKARRKAKNAGKLAKKNGDVHHRDGNPNNNKLSNLVVVSKHKNRSRLI